MSPRNHPPRCPDCGEPMVPVKPRLRSHGSGAKPRIALENAVPDQRGTAAEPVIGVARPSPTAPEPQPPQLTRRERRQRFKKHGVKR